MRQKLKIEIVIDDDIEEIYPNYKTNFRRKDDFLQFLKESIIPIETESYGYSINIINEEKIKN